MEKRKQLRTSTTLFLEHEGNEEWFAENVKYNEIEKSYEKYQYQRVIAGLWICKCNGLIVTMRTIFTVSFSKNNLL